MQASESAIQDEINLLSVDLIDIEAGFNPRKRRDPKKHAENRESIKRHGIASAITVRPREDNPERYFVVAGEGRLLNCRELNFTKIPALIRRLSRAEALAVALAENIHREDMSIADEVEAAMRSVDLEDGNKDAAAQRLGWSRHTLDKRIALRNCNDDVLDALRDNTISIGHAEILARLVSATQTGTLQKCISEQWTVASLKERVNKFARPLSLAKFATDDCAHCPNNTAAQASLFETNLSSAACTNFECWSNKSSAFVEDRVAEMKDVYPLVFMGWEKPASSRTTLIGVGCNGVGPDQLLHCKQCAKQGVVVDDTPLKEGTVILDQCFDLECHASKVKTQEKAAKINASPRKPTNANPSQARAATGEEKSVATLESIAESGIVTSAVKTHQEQHLGSTASTIAANTPHVQLALAVSLLCHHNVGALVESGIAVPRGKAFQWCLTQSIDELNTLLAKACSVHFHSIDRGSANDHEGMDAIATLFNHPKYTAARDLAKRTWTPTENILTAYQKGPLTALLMEADFHVAYDNSHGQDAFLKLMKGKKSDAIKRVLEFSFDWTSFAPKSLLSHVKTTR